MGQLFFRIRLKISAAWSYLAWLMLRYRILEHGMPPQTQDQVSQSFLAKPFPGWGWYRQERLLRELPTPFHFELQFLKRGKKKFSSGAGIIQEKDHPLHGNWILFSPRHVGNVNLGQPHTAWSVSIVEAPEKSAAFDLATLQASPTKLTGFAWIEDKAKKQKR